MILCSEEWPQQPGRFSRGLLEGFPSFAMELGLLIWRVGKGCRDQLNTEFILISHLVGRKKMGAVQQMKCFSHFLCDN